MPGQPIRLAFVDIEIAPIDADQLEAYCIALELAFSSRLEEGDLDRERLIAVPERYLAAWDGGRIVGGAASLPVPMTLPGGRIATTAFVTAVGVQPTHRRRGINTALMRTQLDTLHERGEVFASLWASEGGIYGRFGYGLASMFAELKVDTARSAFVKGYAPSGRVEILDREPALDLMRPVYEEARRARPGMVGLEGRWFDWRWAVRAQHKENPRFHAVHRSPEGVADGFAVYTVKHEWPDSMPQLHVDVDELIALTPEAYADLWRYLFDIDLVATVGAWNRPADEALVWLMAEPRRLRMRMGDALWVRLIDVPGALALRGYAAPGRLVVDVQDRFCPWNEGRFELTVDGSGVATCIGTQDEADLACGVNDLGAVFLGGVGFARLNQAGQVRELTEGSIGRADALFGAGWSAPWSSFII
jgi:predicted acetyltransferase